MLDDFNDFEESTFPPVVKKVLDAMTTMLSFAFGIVLNIAVCLIIILGVVVVDIVVVVVIIPLLSVRVLFSILFKGI